MLVPSPWWHLQEARCAAHLERIRHLPPQCRQRLFTSWLQRLQWRIPIQAWHLGVSARGSDRSKDSSVRPGMGWVTSRAPTTDHRCFLYFYAPLQGNAISCYYIFTYDCPLLLWHLCPQEASPTWASPNAWHGDGFQSYLSNNSECRNCCWCEAGG